MSKLGNPIPPKKFEFVGASARSRTGCINCRLRKKKCDEVKPKCGLCSSRGSDCDWKGQQNEGNNKRKHEEVVQATAESLLKITGKRSNGFEIVTPRKSDVSLADKLGNPTFSFELQNLFTIPVADISNITTTSAINSDLRSTSKSSDHSVTSHGYFFRLSSEKEKVYLEKYISIAQSMSVAGIRNNNSYLSVYLPLANKNQCVLKSLLTWGSMAVEGSNQLFMKETLHSIQTYRQSVTSREQYVFVLASYLILLDAEVTQGDTKRWPLLLENAMTVCQEMGLYNDALDIVKINYINETEKWLILNLIHHDLFSSQACIRGTFLPPSTLLQFSNEKQGTDTLQGCIRPFLVLLSEAINLSIEAKDKYKLLKDSKK